ncbi:MAG: alanine/glycine:cation symporter family protein [Gammaproteobacteria bacterium]|nr:alanine/glycine:cation symporter family protein [Gammaproteobacteria bacterium]
MFEEIQRVASLLSSYAWGPWLLVLLLGGGLFFLVYSRLTPIRYLGHALALLLGRYDSADDPGQINHFQALSSALAGTIGMGNIGGVALAIVIGGPGAIFWMWVTAVVGVATKFFTCSLAVMYRGKDSAGNLQGGPMYVIREGLPKRWHFLAGFFACFGLIGALPAFQANQLTQIVREVLFIQNGWLSADQGHFGFNLTFGALLCALSASVILGGLPRIAKVASRLVPFMAVLYLAAALVAVLLNIEQLPGVIKLIVQDAFTGEAVGGGALLTVILYGVQRGAYSNEAGIGTESLAHGAVRTREPIREGLVAMLGPIIDTLLVCSATAFMILISGAWQSEDSNGVTLTASAFQQLLGLPGLIIIFICVVCFASTTIFTYSFYGTQCASYLFGAHRQHYYRWLYLAFIIIAAIVTLQTAISIIDIAFAMMAIPTMLSALLLAPKVRQAATRYFATLRN